MALEASVNLSPRDRQTLLQALDGRWYVLVVAGGPLEGTTDMDMRRPQNDGRPRLSPIWSPEAATDDVAKTASWSMSVGGLARG